MALEIILVYLEYSLSLPLPRLVVIVVIGEKPDSHDVLFVALALLLLQWQVLLNLDLSHVVVMHCLLGLLIRSN